jgi:hypothetical protein
MIRFFTTKRFGSFRKNIFKYAAYGVGEIILVVIGILIAIQLQNFNDRKNKEDDFEIAISQIELDLTRDIIEISALDSYFSEFDSLVQFVLENKATREIYFEPNARRLIQILLEQHSVNLNQSGYESAKRQIEFRPKKYDSLFLDIDQLYLSHTHIKFMNDQYVGFFKETGQYWRDHYAWYESLYRDINNIMVPSEEVVHYLLTDWNYKNRLVNKRIIIYELHSVSKAYQARALDMLRQIKLLKGNNNADIDNEFRKLFKLTDLPHLYKEL